MKKSPTSNLNQTHPPNQPDIFHRIDFEEETHPIKGKVRWSPAKSLWWSGMAVTWLTLGTIYISPSAVLIFIFLSSVTLCFGHSLGMHRKLIHQAFDCPKWVEYSLVYLGTLVGLGGPFTMMHTHDIRDWAQRQSNCHPFLSHQNTIGKDFFWQLHCKLHLHTPPDYHFPKSLKDDRFYRFLQSTSMLQQLPLGIALFAIGGWGWVAWGICGRVTISILGHWLIGYYAHNQGQRDWHLQDVAVQGYNVKHLGLITFGECWHNNHHAFPGSAQLGMKPGQCDPGWHILCAMQSIGLARNLQTPDTLPQRTNLIPIESKK